MWDDPVLPFSSSKLWCCKVTPNRDRPSSTLIRQASAQFFPIQKADLMVPSTLNGVVLFLVFLMPGVAFALMRERHRPVRRLSAFRETAFAVLVSTAWVVLALSIVFFVQLAQPPVHRTLTELVTKSSKFLDHNVSLVLGVTLAYLVIATSISAFLGSVVFQRVIQRARHGAPDPTSSAWWILFEQQPDHDKILSIILEDGTWLSGTLLSWSKDSDDSPDRELTIRDPMQYRSAKGKKSHPLEGAAVVVSARRILYLSVQYRPNAPDST
ncbi:MAG: putative rane protein [Acidimicrobiaceae bacterium]|nr:putative rane protein [Acidimicrobiaceae bacterium]